MERDSTTAAATARDHALALVGRDAELAAIRRVLDRARGGQGSAVELIAPAGIGKTALVDAAAALACEHALVLRARGVEAELDLPYSGLQTLLRPLAARVAELSGRDRVALEAVLDLRDVPAAPELDVAMATLNLLSLAATDRAVILIVDDLHWMDSATIPVLTFLARRLEHDAIVALFAGRPAADGAATDMAATRLPVGPLTVEATGRLVARQLARPVSPEVAASVAQATGGNPLAVLETVRRLGADVLLLGSELDEPVPVDQLIARGIASRLAPLPPESLTALRLLATMLDASAATLHRALGELGIGTGGLDEAELAGLIARGPGAVAFSHPLVRSHVFHATAPAERRRLHAALAQAAVDPGARAWHAAAGAETEDEGVAAALADQATTFAARGGHLAAAKALALAAQVTPDAEDRGVRLLAAAEEARLAGRGDWTADLLDEAAAAATEPLTQLRIRRIRSILNAYAVPAAEHTPGMFELAEEAAAIDPDLAREILVDLSNYGLVEGMMGEARKANAALLRLGPSERADFRESVAFGIAHVELLSADDPIRAAEKLLAVDLDQISLTSWVVASEAWAWIEAHDAALALSKRSVDRAQASGNLRAVTSGLTMQGYVLYRCGEWSEAMAALEEARLLAEATGQRWDAAVAGAYVGLVECSRGLPGAEEPMRALEAQMLADGYDSITLFTANALGLAELANGRAAAAIPHLERARDWALRSEWIEPGLMPWPADLAEAYIAAGRLDEAAEAIAWLRARADHTQRPWAHAAVARLEALVAGDDYEARYAVAFDRFTGTVAPFDLARTQLAFGRRLRRARRRTDARVHLAVAREGFAVLGATAWEEQARSELRAAGASIVGEAPPAPSTLTSQESVVAELVAQGLPNKQIAAQLFLTQKTVEWHLGQIFRKLGIRSRVQLADYVRRADPVG